MVDEVITEKGSISFCVRKTVVAIVLAKYMLPNKVIMSVPIECIDEQEQDVLDLLSKYRRGNEKWKIFISRKLPLILKRRSDEAKLLSYSEIDAVLGQIVFSLSKHRGRDAHGKAGGIELAVKIWNHWQEIRSTISTDKYWGVTEKQAKECKVAVELS